MKPGTGRPTTSASVALGLSGLLVPAAVGVTMVISTLALGWVSYRRAIRRAGGAGRVRVAAVVVDGRPPYDNAGRVLAQQTSADGPVVLVGDVPAWQLRSPASLRPTLYAIDEEVEPRSRRTSSVRPSTRWSAVAKVANDG